MAATFAATNAVVKGTSPTGVDYFIPELWSDEVLAAHKANLVMQQLVKVMPFSGRKGDTVRVPLPVRGSATAKTAANAVTLITASDTKFDLTINDHYEYSRLIEDIVSVQANDSLRQFYSDDPMTPVMHWLFRKTLHCTPKARSSPLRTLRPPRQVRTIRKLSSVATARPYGRRRAPVTVPH
jgi:hypothetical protein